MATDDENAGSNGDEVLEGLPVSDYWAQPDPELVQMIALINKFGISMSARVFVSAGVVSGELVSISSFYEGLAESIQSDESVEVDPVSSALASVYRSQAEEFRREAADKDLDLGLRHLHVKDAWMFSPGSKPLEIGLWRGRLASISGWSLGSYVRD